MLVLLFELGADRYAIDIGHVIEVLPLVDFRHLPQAPHGVAGLFDFRGTPIPALDLTQLTLGRPAEYRLSTRIIVVHDADAGGTQLVGLIAERATETARREPAEFVWPGVANDRAPYLGPVATDARGLLQLVDVKQLPSWPSPTSNAS